MIAIYLEDGTFCGQLNWIEEFEDWRTQVNEWCAKLGHPTLTPRFITEIEKPNIIPPYIMAVHYLQEKGELPDDMPY